MQQTRNLAMRKGHDRSPDSLPPKDRAEPIGNKPFTYANNLKKQRASIKRTRTAIDETRKALHKALTPNEDSALAAAAVVLGRLASATDSAFRTKKAAKDAELKRREARAKEARAWLKARWEPLATPGDYIRLIVAIARVRSPDY